MRWIQNNKPETLLLILQLIMVTSRMTWACCFAWHHRRQYQCKDEESNHGRLERISCHCFNFDMRICMCLRSWRAYIGMVTARRSSFVWILQSLIIISHHIGFSYSSLFLNVYQRLICVTCRLQQSIFNTIEKLLCLLTPQAKYSLLVRNV